MVRWILEIRTWLVFEIKSVNGRRAKYVNGRRAKCLSETVNGRRAKFIILLLNEKKVSKNNDKSHNQKSNALREEILFFSIFVTFNC